MQSRIINPLETTWDYEDVKIIPDPFLKDVWSVVHNDKDVLKTNSYS